MKILNKPILLPLIFCWLVGCQSNPRQEAAELDLQVDTTLADNVPAPSGGKAPAQEVPPLPGTPIANKTQLPARQFIRSADVKFRVENVAKATDQIEAITVQQGGFVTYTKLDSQADDTQTVAISADSLLETTRYTVSNTMTLRVPNASLDTTLRAISGLANHLDFREIKSDDVALQRLATAQTRQRNAAYDQRLRAVIDKQGQRLRDTNEAEENRLNHQQQTDEARINDLMLVDQLQFSTITLNLYQRQSVQRTVLPNMDAVKVYEPAFLTRVADALATGADVLISFILLLLEGWGLLLFGLIAYFLSRYVLARFRRMVNKV